MAGKPRWYHQGRASDGWHAPRLVRVWIVAPLAVLGAIGAGWLIYRLVVDRLVANASDAIKITLAILTLVGAVLAGVYAYRKQRIAESDAHRADANQFADRYTTAAEQVGHDQAAVRLAGVYALARLADDWQEQRQVCIDVLCAYLRMPYQTDTDVPGYKEGELEVRLTVIGLIRDHLRLDPGDPHSWRGHDFDFTGMTFDGGDFSFAVFSGGTVRFDSATFSGGIVRFDGAVFSGGTVRFNGATFSGGTVRFDGTTFSGSKVSFTSALFSGGLVRFIRARFSDGKVSFDRAMFYGATVDFSRTMFCGGRVSFTVAEVSGSCVRFIRARFSDGKVSFTGAMFADGIVDFDDTTFSGGTVDFNGATFFDGTVRFTGAMFSGGRVSFFGTTFSGGSVDLRSVASWASPPRFDDWVWADPPAGLLLPVPTVVRP
ncbi:pentapeptide repeat-containing protein [Streptomyces sp. NPDC054950]